MSVYIPGMEMPTSCDDCCVFVEDICPLSTWDEVLAQSRKGKPHEKCPLVPVPEHGRLIDASALLQSIKEARKAQPEIADVYDDDYFLVAEWVNSSPTIIPADKEVEG